MQSDFLSCLLAFICCLHFAGLLYFVSICIKYRTFPGKAFTQTNQYDLLEKLLLIFTGMRETHYIDKQALRLLFKYRRIINQPLKL